MHPVIPSRSRTRLDVPSPPLLRRVEAALAARQYAKVFQPARALFEHPDHSVRSHALSRWRNHAAAMASTLPLPEPFTEFWDHPSSEQLLVKTPE